MAGSLHVLDGPDAGRRLPCDAPLHLGRARDRALVVADARVSRRHARVFPAEDGVHLLDLSEDGTRVNGALVHGREVRLAAGDVITLGGVRLRYEEE